MPSIVDRTGPSFELIPSSVENTSLEFPYQVTPKNGYKASPLQLVPSYYIEFYFKVDKDINFAIGDVRDRYQLVFGWVHVGTSTAFITPSGLFSRSGDQGWDFVDDDFKSCSLQANTVYRITIRTSGDNLTTRLFNTAGKQLYASPSSITVPGIGDETRDLFLGFPTEEMLSYPHYDSDATTLQAGLDFTIVNVLPENPGPDNFIEVTPRVLSTLPRLENARIATVIGRHPLEYPLNYRKSTGAQVNPDQTYFTMVGNELRKTSAFTTLDPSTVYQFRVRVRDQYGWSVNPVAYLYTEPALEPHDLALNNALVTAPDTPVGILSTVSDMEGTEDFAYTLVSGENDTNNALFSITNNNLSFSAASEVGTYSCRIRSTSLATGLYVEGSFSIEVQS